MTERKWYKGPPPHIGWWNASVSGDKNFHTWRWWDGVCWSVSVRPTDPIENVQRYAKQPTVLFSTNTLEWSTYWPENARVKRLKP